MNQADRIIKKLNLKPHPEGGHFCETYIDKDKFSKDRKLCSVIYYLLKFDEYSHWHRVDATECWFWHSGAPLVLSISDDGKLANAITLGANIEIGQKPHFIVPKNCWQTAVSTGEWSLVSCLVAPAFQFKGFELANIDWKPKKINEIEE